MTESHSHKEKSGSSNQVSEDDLLEGTSARTRPLSFDEIMLRRKNKVDEGKQVASGSGVAYIALARDNIEKTADLPEYHRQINEDSEPINSRHISNDSHKVSSRRKEDNNDPMKNEKDERSREPDAKSKSIGDRTERSKRERGEENERRHYRNIRKDGPLGVDSDNGSNKRQARDLYRKDKTFERGRIKSEIERIQHLDGDRHVYRKRKTEGQMSSDFDKEYKRRNARDVMHTEKLTNRGREKSEKENRHKRHDAEDKTKGRSTDKKDDSERKGPEPDKTRSRTADKKDDSERKGPEPDKTRSRTTDKKDESERKGAEPDRTKGRSTDKKIDSERKEPEPTRASLQESRPKRRRSRSREREKDRGRRSRSHSPKAHKYILNDKREHVELSSHSTKDRSSKEQSDVDKKRISTNGSSSHYRRNTVASSGLGGYSPRKRKTDAAAKTPSPTRRSPERRNAGWDLKPVEKERIVASSTLPNLQPAGQILSLNIKELPSVTPVTPTMVKPIIASRQTISSQMHAIESVQLTQATRPMRRLYVENLPPSASEKDLIECINKYLLSSGVNCIQGTQPCISCIIHKEKSQALLEFLTPEDASSALSLDGMSFSGSTLKLRRPKDYAIVTTGLSEKSLVAVDSISDVVDDSPHKIFIGGISKVISSKMLLEIARAFGPVKAFRFEFMADVNEACAFLEYVDHSVTSKACGGLNGMRLGGRVVTAVFATPEAVLENVGKLPFYGIPAHAKPLLEKPTAVLKLKNALDPEGLLSLSQSELEEILEDIRLECSRFGTVKSINVAKPTNPVATMEAYEVKNTSVSTDAYDLEFANRSLSTEQLGEESDPPGPTETLDGLENNDQTLEENNGSDNTDEIIAGLVKDEICEPSSNDENEQKASVIELESNDNVSGAISETKTDMENKPLIEGDLQSEEGIAKIESSEEELKLEENNGNIVSSVASDGDKMDSLIDVENLFEPGSVFVEYRREEGACMAAHCLHGRIFDGRVVNIGYVDYNLYQMNFRKRR